MYKILKFRIYFKCVYFVRLAYGDKISHKCLTLNACQYGID